MTRATAVSQPPEQRAPCPRCGESVKDIALQCYVCRADLHVDIEVLRPLADQRAVYEVAKALCAQFPNLQFTVVRDTLQGKGNVLLAHTTRSVGNWIGGVLKEHQVQYELAWKDSAPARGGGSRGARIALVGLVLVLAVAGIGWVYAPGWQTAAGLLGLPVDRPAAARAKDSPAKSDKRELTARELAAKVVPATATVLNGSRQGSGFFVAGNLLVTNQHVIGAEPAADLAVVLENGRRLPAKLLRAEERLDAAVLEVLDAKVDPLPLGDSTSVQRGDRVYAVGAPLGMSFTMSQGIVAHPARRSFGLSYIQIDVSITRGNSGGPLIDEYGQVIGLITYKVGSDATIGLALAIDHLYTGDKPMIAPPPRYDSEKWERELRAAWDEGKADHAAEIAELRLPMLLRAHFDGRKYHVAIGYMGDRSPPKSLLVDVILQTGLRCADLKLDVGGWRVVERVTQATEDLPPSVRTWVEHNRIEAAVRVGFGSFAETRCPRPGNVGDAELVLKGGMPGFERVGLTY